MMLGAVPNEQTRYRIWKHAEKRMQNTEWDKADRAASITSTVRELSMPYPKAWFGERKAEFEDIIANIPEHAEEYCTRLYGDFMKLPPKKRYMRHNTVKIDLENSSTIYKGKYYCVVDEEKQSI